jgi:hypothetical protein
VRRLALLASVLALAPAGTAQAAEVTIDAAVPQSCADRHPGGTPGVASVAWTAPAAGIVTVRLRAPAGDWDLTLFDAAGRRDTGSASFGPRERATAYRRAGEPVVAQVCRRRGPAAVARLHFDLYRTTPPARRERARIVRVPLAGPGALARLEATGLDVTHAHDAASAEVLVFGERELRRLRRLGFRYRVVVPDASADPPAERRAAPSARALPSGRTSYRTPLDYATDLKDLAEQNPGLVRPVAAGRSLEGRAIDGVEIAEGVERGDDGRPVLALFGLHHAREWPSGEMPAEFAIDLVDRYRAGDPRVTDILRRVRVLVVPVVNPDGFEVSRAAGGSWPVPDDDDTLTLGQALADQAAYKRKNCRPTVAGSDAVPCAARTYAGVDLNRNYGAYWGGAGSSAAPGAQSYRGAGPFSEPEAQAIHRLSQTRAPVTVISHHTFTDDGRWLRQPGFCLMPPSGCQASDVTPDEAGMKALGDAMAGATGWPSALAWSLGEITGATEDWNYFATGAYGYTPEQRATNFHADHAVAVVAEYDGSAPGAGGGVREALLRAAEVTADPSHHSVVGGTGRPGHVLRLVKRFATPTSQPGVTVDDGLDLRLTVPATGRFTWHVNPSTRPLAPAKEAYTLRCESPAGVVLAEREVVVDRGRSVDVGDACAAPPAPAAAPPPGASGGGVPPAGTPRRRAVRVSVRLVRAQRRSTVLRRGLLVRATCSADCTLAASVRRPASPASRARAAARLGRVLGRRTLRLRAGRARTFRVRLSAPARRYVARRRLGAVALRLQARRGAERRAVSRRVRLTR